MRRSQEKLMAHESLLVLSCVESTTAVLGKVNQEKDVDMNYLESKPCPPSFFYVELSLSHSGANVMVLWRRCALTLKT
jgi:hypothetical protein